MGLLGSLLLSTCGSWPVRSTERVEVKIDGVVLPVSVDELGAFVRSSEGDPSQFSRSELSTWMTLLAPESKEGLIRLLNAPVLTRRSLGRQLLSSWGAGPLLDALGELIRVEDGGRINRSLVLSTLEQLLERQETVSTLDVLEALPTQQLRLDLDALVGAANRWRLELQRHQALMQALAQQEARLQPLNWSGRVTSSDEPRQLTLAVGHRSRPLRVESWVPELPREDRNWVLMMPGLGGDPNHFHWLARALVQAGWPVALLEHPGSDAAAVQALLEGRQSFDGAEALRQRKADLVAVLDAQQQGDLNIPGDEVVLMGHSLGALTALLASGAAVVPGMEQRCEWALAGLPLTNLSELLQCELAAGRVLEGNAMLPLPRAVVGFNSFGGLIWPHHSSQALPLPLLLVGGTLFGGHAGVVGQRLEALFTQVLGERFGAFATEAINDARFAFTGFQKGAQLVEPVFLGSHPVLDVGTVKAADECARLVHGQLAQNIVPGLLVGGGRRRDQGHLRVTLLQLTELHVFRTEVVPPLGDAVRLVDGKQRNR